MERLLKVYPAKYWGDKVSIIGNREGLIALKETIETALQNPDFAANGGMFTETDDDTTGYTANFPLACRVLNETENPGVWRDLPSHIQDDDVDFTEQENLLIAELTKITT